MVMHPEDRERAVRVVLHAISGFPFLRKALYLKGAYATEGHTGLQRSTTDVDFTVDEELCTPDREGEVKLKRKFMEAIRDRLEHEGGDWTLDTISVHTMPSSKPHPRGWNSFEVRITLQIRGRTRHTVKLEITPEQPPIDSVEVSCETGEVVLEGAASDTVLSYSNIEIVAEKLRAFLQRLPPHREKIRGGSRLPRVRDIWDIAALVETARDEIDIEKLARIFERKCASKFVDCSSVDQFAPKADSVDIFKQDYENDVDLASIPFERAWGVMTGLVRRIELEHGLPGVFPLDDSA